MWAFCHGWFPQLTPPIPRRQQRWLHLPAPAKTRYRTNDPGTHALRVVFSMSNCEDCTFSLFESVQESIAVPDDLTACRKVESFATMNTIRISGRSSPVLSSCQGESVS